MSAGVFIAGIIALICACLVVPQHVHGVLGIRRLHEFIARFTAGFLAIGVLTASCWEIIADNLSKVGWSWGCVSAMDSASRTVWIADPHRDDGKRFAVRADEKLTAFLELEAGVRNHHGQLPEIRSV